MNKTSSVNNQFHCTNNNNNNGASSRLITNGKNVNDILYYGHNDPRIEQYKASGTRVLLAQTAHIFSIQTNNKLFSEYIRRRSP